MTQDTLYNPSFSVEDAEMLHRVVPLTKDHQSRFYPCLWTTDGAICRPLIRGPDFPGHLSSDHGVTGPDRAQAMCCWTYRSAEMKKESLVRHVNEIHLEFKYPCSYCSGQFTRPYTLQNHISKKHTSS